MSALAAFDDVDLWVKPEWLGQGICKLFDL